MPACPGNGAFSEPGRLARIDPRRSCRPVRRRDARPPASPGRAFPGSAVGSDRWPRVGRRETTPARRPPPFRNLGSSGGRLVGGAEEGSTA